MRDSRAPDSDDGTVTLPRSSVTEEHASSNRSFWHLIVLWSQDEPHRLGESCTVPRSALLGRGPSTEPGDPPKLQFSRLRPGIHEPTGALEARALSRRQLRLLPTRDTLKVENLGRRPLLHNGMPAQACEVKEDDTLAIDGVVMFGVARRPRFLPACDYEPFPFGEPDADGLVGETPELWSVRGELRRLAATAGHLLILGESGSGKELCVQAIHRRSSRGGGELVSRNAATIPESLMEAELFGQISGYPNAGAPARRGLFGAADGGTLFLDEIAELVEAQQSNLLRVLDSGEYQRLGEDRLRRSDVRVVGATNRPLQALKADVQARFPERLLVPGLNARRADIPLLIRHILRRLAKPGSALRCSPALVDALVRHRYTLNFRELERLLRLALKDTAADGTLRLSDAIRTELDFPAACEPDTDRIRDVLAASGSVTEAARRLGLPNRWALGRLMKQLGIDEP
jgi:two-component system nitrogen regulation response regulator GlnG/two-component system response regulator HydG